MNWRKILKIVLIALTAILGLLLVFILISVAPVDRTSAQEFPSYSLMMERLDSVKSISLTKSSQGFKVGFAKINLTPSKRTATAGYGNRRGKLFTTVHDSIYVSAIVIDNGSQKVAIVSADLLIMPPAVTAQLESK